MQMSPRGKPLAEAEAIMNPALSSRTRPRLAIALVGVSQTLTACGLWQAPVPIAEELDAGLVVVYPGASNSQFEALGCYQGLRTAGCDQAIEIVPWSRPFEQWWAPVGFFNAVRGWAKTEAERLAAYRAEHPAAPVTLIGGSSGALIAILVTEQMPAGARIDRVLLMSPGVSRYYDLGPMLENTVDGAVVYWSPVDTFALTLVRLLGTIDGEFAEPAAAFGFAATHDKLVQFSWQPEMARYGNYGDHLDPLFLIPWIRDFVAPWIAGSDSEPPDCSASP
jgi:pimeloyl-ACP methyl ester carboxylesterase